jgi:nucleoside 2-deoxyribosyltransferase
MTAVVFANEFTFTGEAGKTCLPAGREMMQHALQMIDDCDLLIAETSDKAIGIGIEAGYAKAKGKKVIYLRNENAEHSTTLSGISDFQIAYTGCEDLGKQLSFAISPVK